MGLGSYETVRRSASARAGGNPSRDKGTRAAAFFAAEQHIAEYAILKAQQFFAELKALS